MAAASGSAVPEVHLVWCCRSMTEMELVGEAIPSMIASAGTPLSFGTQEREKRRGRGVNNKTGR